MPSDRCYYYGCWGEPGHSLRGPGGRYVPRAELLEYYNGENIDGMLAPRRMLPYWGGGLCWQGQGQTWQEQQKIHNHSGEYPQGQFLLHVLGIGFTAIQWWDRCQGDTRGACNSTILLEGLHTPDEMLAALKEHFPTVLENLTQAGVTLVEVVSP